MRDFYSDTRTRPSRAMREAALEAELGDEQAGLDPTTRRLEERVADLLGKEAALFLPSGTMCNEIAIAVQCRPGDAVICARNSHILTSEGGGPAALSGVTTWPLDGPRGLFTADQVEAAIQPPTRYAPRSRLLSLEQTANLVGGLVWPLLDIEAVCAAAHRHGLATHMDGARLLNAAIASGEPAEAHARPFDSVWIDFTKGLGAPVGAVLAGAGDFIDEAWRFKQRWGGAMRQSGILAAMCLHALDHNVDRLAEDHARAHRLADGLAGAPVFAKVHEPETNIVLLDLHEEGPDGADVARRLADAGLCVSVIGRRRLRAVTHLDVGDEDVRAFVEAAGAL